MFPRHSLLNEFQKCVRGIGVLETFFLEAGIIKNPRHGMDEIKKYYNKYFPSPTPWKLEVVLISFCPFAFVIKITETSAHEYKII